MVSLYTGCYFLCFCKANFGSVFTLFVRFLFLRSCELGILKVGGSLGGVTFVSTLFFGYYLVFLLASREHLIGVVLTVVPII